MSTFFYFWVKPWVDAHSFLFDRLTVKDNLPRQ